MCTTSPPSPTGLRRRRRSLPRSTSTCLRTSKRGLIRWRSSRETNISENRLVTLLAALKSVGLIAEREGRLINAPATSKFLVAGAPGDFRDYVRLVNGAAGYESFRHLSTALPWRA